MTPEEEEAEKHARFHNLLIRPNIGEFIGCILFSFMGEFNVFRRRFFRFLKIFSIFQHVSPVNINVPTT